MNMLAQIQNDNNTDQVTMVSLELVDYINDSRKFDEKPVQLRHADFMAKVPKVLGVELSEKFRSVYTDTTGRTLPCYRFPKREACLMAMSYSYELQAQVFDRMTSMEEALKKPALNLDDPAFLRQALLGYTEKVIELEQQVQLQAPKVAFVDKYVAGNGNKTFRQVTKLLGANERKFRDFLKKEKIMYKLNGEWLAYQNHIDAKRFHNNTGISESNHTFTRSLFTPKGVEWTAGEWAKFNLRGAV